MCIVHFYKIPYLKIDIVKFENFKLVLIINNIKI